MKTIVEAIEHQEWILKGWRIKFILSERMLQEVRKLARVDHWYDDPIIVDTWRDRLSICYDSIYSFHETFGIPPQIGDRLFDEDTGVLIQNRSIDGHLKTITFTISI